MSSKIKLLPEVVANQIAAGEVVERPASVIKELVENSLDAGARRVLIEIEQGGRRLIKVVDDGEGMSREDALLALERHATSKISDSRDLFSIHTLGFRGEALPSIASVSEMVLTTRDAAAEAATRVRVLGGAIKSVADAGAPVGTEIVVRRLFHNVPARRKFLKAVNTELGHVTTFVSNMALARPDVHVSLIHNGRSIYDLPSSAELSGRLRHALGAGAMKNLVPVDRTFEAADGQGPLHVHGYVSLPSYTRSSTRGLHVFVNRRFVRDRLINHAVFEAYRSLIPKGKYPLVALFVDLDPDAVDVNVHPAKHEIRFQDQGAVHAAVLEALLDELRSANRAAPARLPAEVASAPPIGSDRDAGVVAALDRYQRKVEREGSREPRPFAPATNPRVQPAPTMTDAAPEPVVDAALGLPGIDFSEARVIGQAAGTFILAEDRGSLLLIDQHAAHERVAFERIRRQWHSESVPRQPLLFPVTVELTLEEASRVADHGRTLLRLGLEVEPFGGGTVAVKALPALLVGADPGKLLLEVVDRLGEVSGPTGLDDRLDAVFAVMACHSVVRANKPMSRDEIRSLLQAMDEAEFAGRCPHGREVAVRIPFRELEKWFGR